MKVKTGVLLFLVVLLLGCKTKEWVGQKYDLDNLKINRITQHVWVHISYLNTEKYGKVPCNGMIVIDSGEAIVFDTPTNNKASTELIDWIEDQNNVKVKAIVATHFHTDCLGGLEAFYRRNIPSNALNRTIILAKREDMTMPQIGFESKLELKVGGKKVICEFLGPGHTEDNIIGYFPSEKVMFGGCLIKAMGAGKGNLDDANVSEWPNTVLKLKDKYKNVEVVVPGHGNTGGIGLLDYTNELFKE